MSGGGGDLRGFNNRVVIQLIQWTAHRSEDIADQLLDIPNYTQPVVLLDSDGYAMSLDQQMQYMREMSGE